MTPDPNALRVVALAADDPRGESDLYPLLRQLRPDLTLPAFQQLLADGYPQGLRYLLGYAADGPAVAAAGYRVTATSRGRILFVDDLVTADAARSMGLGGALLTQLERRGTESGCTALELDSGVSNALAHRFYFRHRLTVLAFHFAKHL